MKHSWMVYLNRWASPACLLASEGLSLRVIRSVGAACPSLCFGLLLPSGSCTVLCTLLLSFSAVLETTAVLHLQTLLQAQGNQCIH